MRFLWPDNELKEKYFYYCTLIELDANITNNSEEILRHFHIIKHKYL